MTTTCTLSLAPLDSTDMAQARAWRNQEEIRRWCREPDLISDAAQARWFQRQGDDPTIRMWKIMATTGRASAPVGVCGLTSIRATDRSAEFSLYVAPEAQRRGLGKIALSLLLTHGFDNLGLHSIWGESFDGNPAARLFERIGLTKEGTRRQAYWKSGRFVDAHLYSILAEEWRARASDLPRADTGASPGDRPVGDAPAAAEFVARAGAHDARDDKTPAGAS